MKLYAPKPGGQMGEFWIDDADEALVQSYRHLYMTEKGYVYALVANGRRFAWLTTILMGKRAGFIVDHADRDPANNRRGNLRFVTHSDNSANVAVRSHSRSGIKGVRWHKQSGCWQARISVAGRGIGLGYYRFKEEAIGAFTAAHMWFHPKLYGQTQVALLAAGIGPFPRDLRASRGRDVSGKFVPNFRGERTGI